MRGRWDPRKRNTSNAYLKYAFDTEITVVRAYVGLFLFGEQGVYRLVLSPSL